MYKNYLKRIFDFSIALLGLICISPILLVLIVVKTDREKTKNCSG